MNFEEEGPTFLRVDRVGKNETVPKKKKVNEKFISIHPDPDEEEGIAFFDEYTVKPGEKLTHIPVKEKERDVLYVCGQSDSGKSYYSNAYIEEYKRMYPKRQIYLFSVHDKDTSLKCKSIKKIKLDDTFVNTALTLDDFRDSLVLFDDIDSLGKSKIKLKTKLQHILHVLLETGRHARCSVIYISHIACKGYETKMILNEANFIVTFPKGMGPMAFEYLFKNYAGLTVEQRKKVRNMKSRAVVYYKSFPNIIFSDKTVWIIKDY